MRCSSTKGRTWPRRCEELKKAFNLATASPQKERASAAAETARQLEMVVRDATHAPVAQSVRTAQSGIALPSLTRARAAVRGLLIERLERPGNLLQRVRTTLNLAEVGLRAAVRGEGGRLQHEVALLKAQIAQLECEEKADDGEGDVDDCTGRAVCEMGTALSRLAHVLPSANNCVHGLVTLFCALLDFPERHGLFFFGQPGTGKTSLLKFLPPQCTAGVREGVRGRVAQGGHCGREVPLHARHP